jgi:hypothetical protein
MAGESGSMFSCFPHETSVMVCLGAPGTHMTVLLDGRQFEALRACLDGFATTGTSAHRYGDAPVTAAVQLPRQEEAA